MLELKNLSFAASAESGTVDILKHIDLTVEDGKFIVITGRGTAEEIYPQILADTVTGCNMLEVDGTC